MALSRLARSSLLLSWLLTTSQQCLVRAEGFTFPTTDVDEFIVGDLVNITWDTVSPRISLYEMCATAVLLESNVSNTQSYVWNATRDHYTESGCAFELVSLTDEGSLILPNLTSVPFGVDPRYTNDPAPTSYNFGDTPSTATSAVSTNTLSSSTTITANPYTASAEPASATTSSSTPNESPTAIAKGGLTTAQKVGVGLGVPLGVLALSLAGALLFMYRRRQRRGRGDGSSAQLPLPPPQQQHLYHSVPAMAEQPKSPFDGSRMSRVSGAETLIAELPAADVEAASEMGDSLRPVSELMGTPRNELT